METCCRNGLPSNVRPHCKLPLAREEALEPLCPVCQQPPLHYRTAKRSAPDPKIERGDIIARGKFVRIE